MLMFRVEFSVAMQPPNCTQISITFCHASETKPNIMFWLISFVISIIFIWRKKCRIIVSHYAVHIQWLSLCVCSFAICILLFFFSSFRWFLNVHRFFFFGKDSSTLMIFLCGGNWRRQQHRTSFERVHMQMCARDRQPHRALPGRGNRKINSKLIVFIWVRMSNLINIMGRCEFFSSLSFICLCSDWYRFG